MDDELPQIEELAPFDQSKRSILVEVAGGKAIVNRSVQRQVIGVDMDVFYQAVRDGLGIPADHQIEFIQRTELPRSPGFDLVIEGPACQMLSHPTGPLYYEGVERFVSEIDSRRESAKRYWREDAKQRGDVFWASPEGKEFLNRK
jgi:hypothetical protein